MAAFIYPVRLHTGSGSAQIQAPTTTTLRLIQQTKPLAAILTENEGPGTPEGMYFYDGTRWRFAIPNLDVSESIINGDEIELFSNLREAKPIPASATVYRNAIKVANTGSIQPQNATIAIRIPRQAGTGTVTGVNGVLPDANGNVTLTPPDIGALPTQPTLDEGQF